jgi:SnoaL-like domain
MSSIPQFAKYAAAFEEAYKSNDWSGVEPFFTEDAVYEVKLGLPLGGRFAGRDAILAYFGRVLDGFDRRFASREVTLLEGPREAQDSVWIRGSARYTAPGLPDLEFALEETAWFEGGRIRRLEDRYDEEAQRTLEAYLHEHGARLRLGTE